MYCTAGGKRMQVKITTEKRGGLDRNDNFIIIIIAAQTKYDVSNLRL